jgi:serine/threonine-protein kinase
MLAMTRDLVGRTVAEGRYEIVRQIGQGGMGSVYLARQTAMDRQVALKLITAAQSAEAVARFQREMKLTAKIEHPNTIRVYDFGEIDGQLYLTMELLRGRSLREELDAAGRLPLERIVRIASQITRALQAAHGEGVVHRDLKPDNVMLNEQYGERDIVKVLDFGVAKSIQDGQTSMTATGAVVGTPIYLSPEQAMGKPIDPRSDLYSLGIMLYEMACGRVPFTAPSVTGLLLAHVTEPPAPLAQVAPDVHPGLAMLVDELLRKDPAGRPASAHHVEARLDAIAGRGVDATLPPMPLASRPPSASLPHGSVAPTVPSHPAAFASAPGHPASGYAGASAPAGHPASGYAGASAPAGHAGSGVHGVPGSAPAGHAGSGVHGVPGSAPAGHAGSGVHGMPSSAPPGSGLHGGDAYGAPPGYGGPTLPNAAAPPTVPLHAVAPLAPRKRWLWAVAGVIVVGAGVAVVATRPTAPSPQPVAPAATAKPVDRTAGRLDELTAKLAAFGDPPPPAACSPDAAVAATALVLEAREAIAGDAARAITSATAALARCPSFAAAHNIHGNALQKAGRLTDAADAYARALGFAPDYDAPRFNLAVIQLRRKDPAAIASFSEILRRKPRDPDALKSRAQAYLNAERYPEALADFEAALERSPDDGQAWLIVGQLRTKLARPAAHDAYCEAGRLGVAEGTTRCLQ